MACLVTNVNPSPHATAHVCYTMNNLMYRCVLFVFTMFVYHVTLSSLASTMVYCRVLRLPWYSVESCVYHDILSSLASTMLHCRVLRLPWYIVESCVYPGILSSLASTMGYYRVLRIP